MKRGDFAIGTFRTTEQANAFNTAHATRGQAYVLDVTDTAALASVTQRVFKEHQDIAVLVNNAGIGFAGAIEETSLTESRRVMEVNFFGALEVTRAFLPHFRRRGGGRIIQISSHGGLKAFPGFGLAETVIDDYAATAGTFRTKIKAVDGKQEGDPARAAAAIFDLSQMKNPPLRLPLGKTALLTIGMKINSVSADLEAARAVAEAAVY